MSMLTCLTEPPYGGGVCKPGIVKRRRRKKFCVKSKTSCCDWRELDSVICTTGMFDALKGRMLGVTVPGGMKRSCCCVCAVICAIAAPTLVPGWK